MFFKCIGGMIFTAITEIFGQPDHNIVENRLKLFFRNIDIIMHAQKYTQQIAKLQPSMGPNNSPMVALLTTKNI